VSNIGSVQFTSKSVNINPKLFNSKLIDLCHFAYQTKEDFLLFQMVCRIACFKLNSSNFNTLMSNVTQMSIHKMKIRHISSMNTISSSTPRKTPPKQPNQFVPYILEIRFWQIWFDFFRSGDFDLNCALGGISRRTMTPFWRHYSKKTQEDRQESMNQRC
jgi:hypothetical protein